MVFQWFGRQSRPEDATGSEGRNFRYWDILGLLASLGLVVTLQAALEDSIGQRLLLAALALPLVIQWFARRWDARDLATIVACLVVSIGFQVSGRAAISGDWLVVATLLALSLSIRFAWRQLGIHDGFILTGTGSLVLLLSLTSQLAGFPMIPQFANCILTLPPYPNPMASLNTPSDRSIPPLEMLLPPPPAPAGAPAGALAIPMSASVALTGTAQPPASFSKPWSQWSAQDYEAYGTWVKAINPNLRRVNVEIIHYERQLLLHNGLDLVILTLLLYGVARPLVRQIIQYLGSHPVKSGTSLSSSTAANGATSIDVASLGTPLIPIGEPALMKLSEARRLTRETVIDDLRYRARQAKLMAYLSVGLILICLVSGMALFAFADTIYSRNRRLERIADQFTAAMAPNMAAAFGGLQTRDAASAPGSKDATPTAGLTAPLQTSSPTQGAAGSAPATGGSQAAPIVPATAFGGGQATPPAHVAMGSAPATGGSQAVLSRDTKFRAK